MSTFIPDDFLWSPQKDPPDVPIIAMEGNIGAGKSTLCQDLMDGGPGVSSRLLWVQEPVEDNPYLERFYKDPATWALHMQMWLVGQRARLVSEACALFRRERRWIGVLLDRSLLGDRCFALVNKARGAIPPAQWMIYNDFYTNCMRLVPRPTLLFWLQDTPKECLIKVQKRGRKAEAGIELSYLNELHAAHAKAFRELQDSTKRFDWKWQPAVQHLDTRWNRGQRLEMARTSIQEHCTSINDATRIRDVERLRKMVDA